MGNIISKMELYDLFARGVTGVIVLCAAHVFGIVDILGKPDYVWVIVIGGYFLGLVLEELSFAVEKVFHSRERVEQEVCSYQKYREYDFEKCKDALLANNQNIICDEPLSHIIMSSSFEIAFVTLLLFEIADEICYCKLSIEHYISPVKDILILEALVLIFRYRAKHYIKHRTEKIFDYCIAQDYPGIKKTLNKDKTNET